MVISDQVLELGSDEATIVLRGADGAGLTFPSALEANTLVSLVDEADMAESGSRPVHSGARSGSR